MSFHITLQRLEVTPIGLESVGCYRQYYVYYYDQYLGIWSVSVDVSKPHILPIGRGPGVRTCSDYYLLSRDT